MRQRKAAKTRQEKGRKSTVACAFSAFYSTAVICSIIQNSAARRIGVPFMGVKVLA